MDAVSAADSLRRQGYAVREGVLSRESVGVLRDEVHRRLGLLQDPGAAFSGGLDLEGGRHMVNLELSGPFSRPDVYANPLVLEVLQLALDHDFVLESFGVVVALPGARTQARHRDGLFLFDEGIGAILPAYAITVAIPLVDMNAEQGTSAVLPGSHRPAHWNADTATPLAPEVAAGSCLMWDFRTLHYGTENRSARSRPLLYMTYSRAWWRDVSNYPTTWDQRGPRLRQQRLIFGPDFWSVLPGELRFLFRHVDART